MFEKLVTKVNARFFRKSQFNTVKSDIEKKIDDFDKKIHDISGFVKISDYNTKFHEIEDKTRSITGLSSTAAITTVENKIPNVSDLTKTKEYDKEILVIEIYYIQS